jgi:hypothetical protein
MEKSTMRNVLRGGLAALAGLLLLSPLLSARRIAIPSVAENIGKADVVVIGKVTAIEAKTVKTPQGEFGVAVVKIETPVVGAKGLTHVKVGIRGGDQRLKVGSQACLYLHRVQGEGLLIPQAFFDVVASEDAANFAKQGEALKRCARLLADPTAALKSKDANERFTAAALLVLRYRAPKPGAKQEAVPAAESKLILEALADADWTRNDAALRLNAQTVFFRLGLSPTDGWMQPGNFQELPAAAKKWLKDNAGKYTLKRTVPVQTPGPK